MTYEETGQVIDRMINDHESERMALHMAKEALEKQIPKSPKIVQSSEFKDRHCLYCPTCRSQIGWYEDEARVKVVRFVNYYCTDCGQHIMWGIDS